jgi:hypothetical protein
VPASARKLVQGLKEIVGRPDAEIYAALRDCGMDPDEAVSRLLSQGLAPAPLLLHPYFYFCFRPVGSYSISGLCLCEMD